MRPLLFLLYYLTCTVALSADPKLSDSLLATNQNAFFSLSRNVICSGDTVTVTDLSSGTGTRLWNFGNGSNPTITSGTGPFIVTYSGTGSDYIATITLTVNGTDFYNTTLTVKEAPTHPYAGADQNSCGNTIVTLLGNVFKANEKGHWSKVSGPSVNIYSFSTPLTSIIGIGPVSGVFQWMISVNGVNVCKPLYDTVQIFNTDTSQANAGGPYGYWGNNIICGTALGLNAIAPVLGSGSWSIVKGSGSFSDYNNPAATVTGLSPGVNVLEWSVTTLGCSMNSANVSTLNLVFNGLYRPQSISLQTSQTTFCGGTFITLTGNVLNIGTSPHYAFYKNGIPPDPSQSFFQGNVYIDKDPSNNAGYQLSYTDLTGDPNNCITPVIQPLYSNVITISGTTTALPSITIMGSQNPVCSGTGIQFSVDGISTNENFYYTWQRNGLVISSGTTLSSIILNNGDIITGNLTMTGGCYITNKTTSNIFVATVIPNLTASLHIIADLNTAICSGTGLNFTAIGINTSANDMNTWYNNGIPIGQGTLLANVILRNKDVITAEITNTGTCFTNRVAISNLYVASVSSTLTLNNSASFLNNNSSICAGTLATFSGVLSEYESPPLLEWFVNDINTYTTRGINFTYLPKDFDKVYLKVTSRDACSVHPVVTTSSSMIHVVPDLPVNININNTHKSVCIDSSATLYIDKIVGFIKLQYQTLGDTVWSMDNKSVLSIDSLSFTTSPLHKNTKFRVQSQTKGCPSLLYGSPININPVPLPVSGTAKALLDTICGASSTVITLKNSIGSVRWFSSESKEGAFTILSNTNVNDSLSLTTPDISTFNTTNYYKAEVHNTGCNATVSSNVVSVTTCSDPDFVPGAFTPNVGNVNSIWDLSHLRLNDDATIQVFNRYGTSVYEASGAQVKSTPWDGGSLPAATYYYIIDRKNSTRILKGPVTLIK